VLTAPGAEKRAAEGAPAAAPEPPVKGAAKRAKTAQLDTGIAGPAR
jgi:hypothetical protein